MQTVADLVDQTPVKFPGGKADDTFGGRESLCPLKKKHSAMQTNDQKAVQCVGIQRTGRSLKAGPRPSLQVFLLLREGRAADRG